MKQQNIKNSNFQYVCSLNYLKGKLFKSLIACYSVCNNVLYKHIKIYQNVYFCQSRLVSYIITIHPDIKIVSTCHLWKINRIGLILK